MSDKEKIKEEIEKQIDYVEDDTRYTESYREGLIAAYQTIKAFIDSLPEEPASKDLKEVANQHSKQTFNGLLIEDNIDAFIAGAEWQKQKDLQDFLEKAMGYFRGKPIHHFWVEQFKNYMEEEL